jgi:hypothetical protein
MPNDNYFDWLKNAIVVFGVSASVTLCFNAIVFKKEFKEFLKILNRILRGLRKNEKNRI